MGILDDYKAQLAIDRENENKDFPEGSNLTEEQREEYEKTLDGLRHSSIDMEEVYEQKKKAMRKMEEVMMEENNYIVESKVERITVKHANCPECGQELISDAPPMFNPFTLEKICKHTCKKCGAVYNLEYAYPRIVIYNEFGEEVPAFTR